MEDVGVSTTPTSAWRSGVADVGGRPTADGRRMRLGLGYRSGALGGITAADRAALAGLGVRVVYDLRTDEERLLAPEVGRLPDGTGYVVADVLGDEPDANPARFMRLLADAGRARQAIGHGRGVQLFRQRYRDFVRLGSARAAYGRFLAGLADVERLPALVHCTTGKDRTGWAVAILQLALGVSKADVLDAFVAASERVRPAMTRVVERWVANGGSIDDLEPLLDVRPAYLETAIEEARRSFGSLDGYLADGLGIDRPTRTRLEAIWLEPA